MAEFSACIDDVRSLFERVLAGDIDTLRRIETVEAGLELSSSGLLFTLPALHAFIDPEAVFDYRKFRNLLYQSSLNQELSALDAEIVVLQSTGKVDSSRYCLRRRT